MKEILQENMLNFENNLSKYATKDKDAVHLKKYDKDIRPSYFRDIDKIIHSLSYTRYLDKTQVFSLVENDNISKRIERTMSKLKVDEFESNKPKTISEQMLFAKIAQIEQTKPADLYKEPKKYNLIYFRNNIVKSFFIHIFILKLFFNQKNAL
jgi:hypothetical protein